MVPVVGKLSVVPGEDGLPLHLLLEAEDRHTQLVGAPDRRTHAGGARRRGSGACRPPRRARRRRPLRRAAAETFAGSTAAPRRAATRAAAPSRSRSPRSRRASPSPSPRRSRRSRSRTMRSRSPSRSPLRPPRLVGCPRWPPAPHAARRADRPRRGGARRPRAGARARAATPAAGSPRCWRSCCSPWRCTRSTRPSSRSTATGRAPSRSRCPRAPTPARSARCSRSAAWSTPSTFFQVNATVTGRRGKLRPGDYTLLQGMSNGAALDALVKGPKAKVVKTVNVTVPEGLSIREAAPDRRQGPAAGSYLKAARSARTLRKIRDARRAARHAHRRGLPVPGHLHAARRRARPATSWTASSRRSARTWTTSTCPTPRRRT